MSDRQPDVPGHAARESGARAEPDEGPFRDILDGCLAAVAEEIAAVRMELERRGLRDAVPAHSGRMLGAAGPGFRYELQLSGAAVDIRVDDAVKVTVDAVESLGFVQRFDRRTGAMLVRVGDYLGRTPAAAELEFDPTWLLSALAGRLALIADQSDRFFPATALQLFGRTFPRTGREQPLRDDTASLNQAQLDALERILGSEAHFVWGPPGTGKTRLVGHAAAELAERGKVLVTSTTNVALDEAAARVASVMGESAVAANRILRVGAEFSGTGDERLSLGAAIERRIASGAGGIARRLEDLEARLGAHQARGAGARPMSVGGTGSGWGRPQRWESAPEEGEDGRPAGSAVPDVRARLAHLAALARAQEDEEAQRGITRLTGEVQRQSIAALKSADVVLCTLARLAARDELAALRFDSLILDEASAAPLPYVVFAACLARRRAVAIGDFQQLPPVVVSRGPGAERWLSRDVFREAGVIGEPIPGEIPLPAPGDALCAMLVEQYRMVPDVRALVSELFYGGRLVDAPEILDRESARHSLVLVDTSSLRPSVEREEGSRANAVHAEVVTGLLEGFAAQGVEDVAVVVPYRLQSRRIWRLARSRLGRAAPNKLEISTVHRYQGREKSLVIFDTVDSPPGRSWFLNEGSNPDFPRLLNVALSRTRDMLVIVGNLEGLRQTLPQESLLLRAVEIVRASGRVVDAAELRSSTAVGGPAVPTPQSEMFDA